MPYTKTEWNGAKLNPSNLNKIESGIETAEAKVESCEDRLAEYDEAFRNVNLLYRADTDTVELDIGNDNTPNVRVHEVIQLPRISKSRPLFTHAITFGTAEEAYSVKFASMTERQYTLKDLSELEVSSDISIIPVTPIVLGSGEAYSYISSSKSEYDDEDFVVRLYKNLKNGTTKTIRWISTDGFIFKDEVE